MKIIPDKTYLKLLSYLSQLNTPEARQLTQELESTPRNRTSNGSYILSDRFSSYKEKEDSPPLNPIGQ